MNIFEVVKSVISIPKAAQYYGLNVNRNHMTCCPFHDDHTPSMKLNDDYFYCFGCGTKGDVVDLIARLFDLSSYEAAQKLADDFGITQDRRHDISVAEKTIQKSCYPLARTYRQEEIRCQRILCDYLHFLEKWKAQYAPKTPADPLDDRFVEACQMKDYVEGLTDVLTFAELKIRVNVVDRLQKEGVVDDLEKRMKRLKEEARYEESEKN